ncbi:MAG: GntR family transcriptional regulator [Betaproteobacteria bacterium]
MRAPRRRTRSRAPRTAPLRDQAYDAIKRRIITLRYRPGACLSAAQVRDELGLGLTPVNLALNRLMLEGMIEVIPRKGAIVRPISLDEVLAVIEVRIVNEMTCARLAVARATDADIDAIENVVARAEKLTPSRDIEALMLLDREFHSRLARAARNAVLSDILLALHEKSLRFWFISLSDEKHLSAVQHEHRSIVYKLRARDADGVAAAMRAHIESFRDTIMKNV